MLPYCEPSRVIRKEIVSPLDPVEMAFEQLADLISFAIYRHFEHSDGQFYEVIREKFDSEGGVVHGLYVKQ